MLANRPKSELTSYQRQLVKEQGRTISAKEIATKTGIPESEINKRIQWYDVWSNRPVLGVDPGSIRFRRGEGYVARSTTGKKLVFYIVRTGNGQTGYFGSVADIQKLADNIDKAIYPELVGAEIIIPGRNG